MNNDYCVSSHDLSKGCYRVYIYFLFIIQMKKSLEFLSQNVLSFSECSIFLNLSVTHCYSEETRIIVIQNNDLNKLMFPLALLTSYRTFNILYISISEFFLYHSHMNKHPTTLHFLVFFAYGVAPDKDEVLSKKYIKI